MLASPYLQSSIYFESQSPQSNMYPTGYPNAQRAQAYGFGGFVDGSQDQLQGARPIPTTSNAPIQPIQPTQSPLLPRQHSHHKPHPSVGQAQRRSSGTKSDHRSEAHVPVRRRISRACDQCNQLRTKCDGGNPCSHCVEFELSCEYFRERKKRGKASRKDLAEQQVSSAIQNVNPPSPTDYSSEDPSSTSNQSHQGEFVQLKPDHSFVTRLPPPTVSLQTMRSSENVTLLSQSNHRSSDFSRASTISLTPEIPSYKGFTQQQHQQMANLQHNMLPSHQFPNMPHLNRAQHGPMSGLNFVPDYDPNGMTSATQTHILQSQNNVQQPNLPLGSTNMYSSYSDGVYALASSQEPQSLRNGPITQGSEGSLNSIMTASPVANSSWLSQASPSYQSQNSFTPPISIRYPVLQPLLSSIGGIIPISLANELLELYFTSSTSAYMRPVSPYLLGYLFRKQSILHPTRPRVCSPALLCSMLWVAAQTSDAPFLTSLPSTRGNICQKLLQLTIDLLRPLVHSTPTANNMENPGPNPVLDGEALGGLGVLLTNGDHQPARNSATGAVDVIATYIHLATVVSASEYKAASLRWWNAAWSLARELKLGRELPLNPVREQNQGDDADGDYDLDMTDMQQPARSQAAQSPPISVVPMGHGFVSEEEREERRRVWWLVYTMDRHLAFCYNRPLFLLDAECEGLFQPLDEGLWQAGEFFAEENAYAGHLGDQSFRRRGPSFECTGHSIFGFFTPLMTILGEIVDLHHARNHPKFGIGFKGPHEWDDRATEITQQLEYYGRSLKEFEARTLKSIEQTEETGTPSRRSMNESILQTKTVVAYGTDVMHVLHIALTGKWDPISLLDDNDLWISSQSFISATGHAVSAAEAIGEILEYDPDLIFMPFFIGIYLLQGSFLLLLIADKLQGEASPSVVKACETIVRAHEACIVTLNTEYQRNFRKVMRSALAQVKGRVQEDSGEQQLRRREVLSLYRWSGDGTGLAL